MSSPPRLYATDLSDAEWRILEPLIPRAKPGGRPAITLGLVLRKIVHPANIQDRAAVPALLSESGHAVNLRAVPVLIGRGGIPAAGRQLDAAAQPFEKSL